MVFEAGTRDSPEAAPHTGAMGHRMRHHLAFVAMIGTLLLLPRVAEADPETGDALFRQGHAALVAGDYPRACDLLQRSLTEDPSATGTLINLAYCQQMTGKHWLAYRAYADALRKPISAERRSFADKSSRQVERKLPHVQLQMKDATVPVVEHDDGFVVVDPTVPFPIAPGRRTLTLTSAGKKPRTVSFEVPDRAGVVIVVVAPVEENEALVVTSPPPTATAAPPPSPPPPAPGPPASDRLEGDRGGLSPALGWASLGVGVAALGAGTYFGLRSFAIRDDACPTTSCDRDGLDRIQGSATTTATVSTIAFGVAVAALALGTWVFLHPPRRERAQAR
jgi:hypothetical protein